MALSDEIKKQVEERLAKRKELNPDKFTWRENEVHVYPKSKETKKGK